MRLERSAGELRGEARKAVLRRWVAVLKVLRFPVSASFSALSADHPPSPSTGL